MPKAEKMIWLLFTAITFSACTEKIDLTLQDAEPVIMIEGNISDRTDAPAFVLVSQTTSYNVASYFHGLSGAIVTINDGTQTDTLTEVSISGVSAGVYSNTSLIAQAGKVYTLTVQLNGKSYQATSQTVILVELDSLSVDSLVTIAGKPSALCNFNDPVGVTNYYKTELLINGELQPRVNISRDGLMDGRPNQNLDISSCETGDTIDVYLESIDENIFNYFFSLNNNASSNSPAPSNPVSNISGGCLGYFCAYTSSHQRMIYP